MKKEFKINIKITKILGNGICPMGHKVDQTFLVDDFKKPEGLCSWAFNSIYPFLTVLRFGGTFPWSQKPDQVEICCPDPANPVVFELKRIK